MTNTNTITAQHLYDFELIKSCVLSPNGKYIAYSVETVDRKTEKKYTHLHLITTATGESTPITFGKYNNTMPKWSPDSSQLAFISDRAAEKQYQIYCLPLVGGEARQITTIKGTIGALEWSPNGQQLVVSFRAKDQEVIAREKDEEKKKLGIVERHYTRLFYKLDGGGYLPQQRWGLILVDINGEQVEQLTSGTTFDDYQPTWSPDGRHIAFISNRHEQPELHPDHVDLWLLEVATKNLRKIDTPVGSKSLPSFSHNGAWLAYVGSEYVGEWWRNKQLYIVAINKVEAPICLTDTFGITVESLTLNDMGGLPTQSPPSWSLDDEKLYFEVSEQGSTHFYGIHRLTKQLFFVIKEQGTVGHLSMDAQQKQLSFVKSSITDPNQVAIKQMNAPSYQTFTQLNQSIFDNTDLGQIEELWFKGNAGNDLQGWILKPPAFDATKQYPAILEIHGGPLLQYGESFMHEFYYLAAQGYVVFFCNPRGGKGYGEEHAKAIWGNWGTADYEDLMTWTDIVASKPYVDENRLGVTGGSYGGYMTNWIIGHTNRFKAAVTQRCVSNLISMWGTSDFNWVFQQTFGNKSPYESIDDLWRMSPIRYFGHVTTPTLVIHSEQDYRCCQEQGEQVFVALKKLGVPTELVLFPNESHGLSRGGRTDRKIARLQHIARWMNRYLTDADA